MNTPIKGKDKVLMFRLLQDMDKANASRLSLQTTHTIKKSRKIDSKSTKDGNVASVGQLETSIDIEAIASDDLTNEILAYAQAKGLELEVWEINFDKPKGNDKFEALYGHGYLSDWEAPANVDENTTIKTTLTTNGEMVKGDATVSALDQATVKNFFRDTQKGSSEVTPADDAPSYGNGSSVTSSSNTSK